MSGEKLLCVTLSFGQDMFLLGRVRNNIMYDQYDNTIVYDRRNTKDTFMYT